MAKVKSDQLREIKIQGNEYETISLYPGNTLNLSRYSWLTIIPKNLFEQFQRPSNVWFVLVSVFQLLPLTLNPTDSWTTILPLSLLLLLTLLKDAYIDYKLHKHDETINKTIFLCWDGSEFVPRKSEELLVGHIVIVKCNQVIPADMLLLDCSNENKCVYSDISKLTGTSVIKKVSVIEKHARIVMNIDGNFAINNKLVCTLKISEPNHDYSAFYGRLKFAGDPGSLELKETNVLFKGSVLQGCEQIVGLCMYCGYESKLQMNSKKIYHKTSRLEKKINTWVVFILTILVLIVSFCLLGYYVIGGKPNDHNSKNTTFLQPIVTFVLLFNNIIPISLFMVIDIIRIIQTYIISKSDINVSFNYERVIENLGQVDFILTDKTGTITENDLKVNSVLVNGKRYTVSDEEIPLTEPNRLETEVPRCKLEDDQENTDFFRSILNDQDDPEVFKEFMKCMTLCNTLNKFKLEYLGSRDEKALVECARLFGYHLVNISSTNYTLNISGVYHNYEVIALRQFSIKSKKSRVLLYENQENFGVLYFKGDPFKSMSVFDLSKDGRADIQRKCHEMNEKGLRTMVLGYKKIPLEELADYRSRIKKAEHSLINVEGKIDSIFKEIEKNIEFLGVTFIEDQILPETIQSIINLKTANIKIWLLSGDSYGNTNLTALTSKIVENDSEKIYIESLDTEYTCFKTLKNLIFSYIFDDNRPGRLSFSVNGGGLMTESLDGDDDSIRGMSMRDSFSHNTRSVLKKLTNLDIQDSSLDRYVQISKLDYSVFIDRQSILTALSYESCRKLIVILLVCAKSVVFSEMMPEDKGSIVKMLRENVSMKPVVVAIGDGEGDISMLQNADIGISVNPQKDTIIKNFSDLSIRHFAALERLILVYGHWNYSRLSRAVYLFLYKNFLLTSMLFTYTLLCSFSGTSLFDATLLVGYNIFFTTLPVLVVGIFDEDLPEDVIYSCKQIYMQESKGKLADTKKIMMYGGLSTLHWGILSALLFACTSDVVSIDGNESNLAFLGTVVYIILIAVVLIQIHLDTYCLSWLYYCSQVLSVVFLVIFVVIQDRVGITSTELIGVGQQISRSPFGLFSIFFSCIACIIPSYWFRNFKKTFFPSTLEMLKSGDVVSMEYSKFDEFNSSLSKIYCTSSTSANKSQDSKFSMSKITLKYRLPYMETEYEELYIQENSLTIKLTVFVIWILLILWTVFSATIFQSTYDYSLAYTLVRIVITVCFCVLVFLLFTEHFWKFYKYYIIISILVGLIIKFILEISFNMTSILATALVPSVTYVLLNVDWFYILLLNVLNVLFGIVSFQNFYRRGVSNDALSILKYSSLTIAIAGTSSIVGYYLVLSKKTEHKLMNISNSGVERTQSILSLLLPPFVKNKVKDGARYIAEAQDEVSVLFCDICDFESICREYKPNDLRLFLDSLFKIFDTLCENTGVTKIETVGKTYMACAGLSDSELELSLSMRNVHHARRVVELANSMIQEVSLIRLTNGNTLQVKIGINTGPVIAGVVGHHKPQFSLVGDTVNTASRMCSTLNEYNAIQVSISTYSYLKSYDDLGFKHSSVEAKGKGRLDTFIVTEVRYDNSSDMAGGPNLSKHHNSSSNFNATMSSKRSKTIMFETFQTLMDGKDKRNEALISPTGWFRIKWKESEKEKEFRINKVKTYYKVLLISLIIALVTYIINLIISLLEYYYLSGYSNISIIIGRGVVIAAIAVIISFYKKLIFYQIYPMIIILILLVMLIVALFNLIYDTQIFTDFISLEIMYVVVLLYHSTGASHFLLLVANVFVFVPWIILVPYSANILLNITNLVLVACFSGINFLAVYIQDKKNRTNHNLTTIAAKEINETEKLLVQMMPPNVFEDLQNDKIDTDKIKEVTILFADIVGFTNWSSNKSPDEVVMMLSQLFTRFDKKCVENDVYKVHTIGDCYVVLGHNGKSVRDPLRECLNVVRMAQDMIDIIKDENKIHDSDLNMRIGIHKGYVIGGVIGTNTVRYDIWGPDVLIANKMESSGQPGMINVSEDCRNLLLQTYDDKYQFSFNSEVRIESLRKNIKCYFLTSE